MTGQLADPQTGREGFRRPWAAGRVVVMLLPYDAHQLAVRQYGAVARHQLCRWMTASQIDGLVRRGYLVVIERGVYRVHAGAVPPEQAAMAAVLRIRQSRIAGPFLLGLYGAEGFARTDPFCVLLPHGTWPRGITFPISRDPCPGQHAALWEFCLPVITPTMACLDAAHPRYGIDDKALRIAIDSLRWARRTTTKRLDSASTTLPRHPGARRIRRMLDDLTLVSESEPERQFGTLLDRVRPRPKRQQEIAGYRVDFVWPRARVIVEYDGEVHDRPDRRQADARRDRDLEAAGYLVIHVRAADLRDSDRLLRRLQEIIQTRSRHVAPQ